MNQRGMDFGVFFFAALGDHADQTYRLVLDSARKADRLGFTFVSTPERHFHRFGGAFPNPAVTSAAIAAVTERVQIRAGSVVTPLHPTVRVIENFAMVDCISGGRVGISVGSGWNVNDFAIAPSEYEDRKQRMISDIETVRSAWRSGTWTGVNAKGKEVTLDVYPRPISAELDMWTTASRSEETFRQAGVLGTNVLTHLENQDIDGLAAKIDVYRAARAEHGWTGRGKVTVMMHTYVAPTTEQAHAVAGPWLRDYVMQAIDLESTAVKGGGLMSGGKQGREFMELAEAQERLCQLGVNRYLDGHSLIGSPQDCAAAVTRVSAAGVDEIACLVDFVGDAEAALAGLDHLNEVRQQFAGELVSS